MSDPLDNKSFDQGFLMGMLVTVLLVVFIVISALAVIDSLPH